MKITLAKFSAMALVAAASVVSSEKPAVPSLRGPVALVETSSAAASAGNGSSPDTFFPDEMNETKRNNRNGNNDDDDDVGNDDRARSSSPRKKSAQQKRQDSRDARRRKTNPDRSQSEEQAERNRKSKQAGNRGNRCVDPSESGCGNDNYPRNREARRRYECDTTGRGCEHERVTPRNEPNRRRGADDADCIRSCNDEYPNDTSASEDFSRNRRNRNSNNSRAMECANRRCDGKEFKNGAKTLKEWLLLAQE